MLNVRQPIEQAPTGFSYEEFNEWKVRERIDQNGSDLTIGWRFGPMWAEKLEAHDIACDAYLIAFWKGSVKWSELPVQYKAKLVGDDYQGGYRIQWGNCLRFAVQRMGFVFYGHQSLNLNRDDYLQALAPDKIPFHLPALVSEIQNPTLQDWFTENRWIVELAR